MDEMGGYIEGWGGWMEGSMTDEEMDGRCEKE